MTRCASLAPASATCVTGAGTLGDPLEAVADVAVTEADVVSAVVVDAVGTSAIDVEAVDAPIDAEADAPFAATVAFFNSVCDVELPARPTLGPRTGRTAKNRSTFALSSGF